MILKCIVVILTGGRHKWLPQLCVSNDCWHELVIHMKFFPLCPMQKTGKVQWRNQTVR